MIEIFKTNPLVLLFVVAALGYLIGSIKIKGSGLGVAAVLFVGLGCGALDPDLRISELVIFLGLSVFIYMIALQSGATFFSTFSLFSAGAFWAVTLPSPRNSSRTSVTILWIGFFIRKYLCLLK